MKLHPNIEIKLNTKVDVDTLRALNPDQVIVSPGGGISPIDVPGIDGKNVVKSEDIKAMCNGIVPEGKGMIWKAAVAAIKAQGGTVGFMRMGLNMKSGPTAIVGKRVVVVGGGFAGLEVAEAMCDGREIWVIDPAKKLGNGIGIIDIRAMYGIGAVAQSKSIDLVIHMEKWVEGKEYDRLGLNDEYITILGVKVPSQTMPVRPGRNLAIIIEVAARNLSMKKLGFSAARELDRRMNEMIMKRSNPDAQNQD